jgi:hypothetical protein
MATPQELKSKYANKMDSLTDIQKAAIEQGIDPVDVSNTAGSTVKETPSAKTKITQSEEIVETSALKAAKKDAGISPNEDLMGETDSSKGKSKGSNK